ncbi:MAG: hypothetical protein LBH05_04905 [Deferribacteraceae bacterium]|nr:hypothetical protein [Deferribacteraceae bacterium]
MIGTIIVIIIVAQLLRLLLFGNVFLRPLWSRFYDIPLLGYFLKCAFCQGFWLGFFTFLPLFGLLDSVMWGLMSAWLSLYLHTQITGRRESGE